MSHAEVAEQADALRSGRSELYAHVGSTPTFGTSALRNSWGLFTYANSSPSKGVFISGGGAQFEVHFHHRDTESTEILGEYLLS